MKIFIGSVFVLIFVSVVQAALIVPYWQHLRELDEIEPTEVPEESKEIKEIEEAKEPEEPKELEKLEETEEQEEPEEEPKASYQTDIEKLQKALQDLKKRPQWKSLSKEDKQFMTKLIMMVVYNIHPPKFSPFGG